jgi:hypothetical protein
MVDKQSKIRSRLNAKNSNSNLYQTQANFGASSNFEQARYASQQASPKAGQTALLKDNPGSG